MDYTGLSTAIQDYCQNSELSFVANINNFIITAEDRIFAAVQIPSEWNRATNGALTPASAEYTVTPAANTGAVDVLSVRIGETVGSQPIVTSGPVRYLLLKDYDFLLEAYPGASASVSETITGISKAIEAVVTATNTFANGDSILISGLVGMGELEDNYYTVSDVSSSQFKLKSAGSYVDSTDFAVWISDGICTSGADLGIPKYYAISSAATAVIVPDVGDAGTIYNPTLTIRLGPIPDKAYPMTTTYYGKTTTDSITSTVTSGEASTNQTWLSVTFPNVLLYGALVQAYIYMKGEPDLIQMYEKQFSDGLLLLLNTESTRMENDDFRPSTTTPSPAPQQAQ